MEHLTNTDGVNYGTIDNKKSRDSAHSSSTILSDTLTIKSELTPGQVKRRKRLCLKAPNGKLFYGISKFSNPYRYGTR